METAIPLSDVSVKLLEAKNQRKLSFSELGEKLGHSEVYTAALFYGQAKPSKNDIENLAVILGIDVHFLTNNLGFDYYPQRGRLVDSSPVDPTLYRLHELLKVYGYPIKAIINEKFGDGIMSAVDCSVHVHKVEKSEGDRVKIVIDGKFLPYKNW